MKTVAGTILWPSIRRLLSWFVILLLPALAACAPRLQNIGADVDPPALTDTLIHTADGVDLPLRSWLPKDSSGRLKPVKGVIVALHGFNDYSKGLEIPGAGLARRGYAVYAYDQRGFGQTPQRGIWASEARMISDLRLAIDLIHRTHPDLPIFVLGESMGAAVAMVASVEAPPLPIDGMILVSPATWGRATMSPFYRQVLEMTAHSVPWMTVLLTTVRVEASNNRAALRAMGRDPLVIKATRVDAAYGLVNLMSEAYDSLPLICDGDKGMPRCLILYGGREDILAKGAVTMTLDRIPVRPNDQLQLVLYRNGHHLLLRDLDSQKVFDDIAAWIADPKQPLPSAKEATAVAPSSTN